jgi:hypothetical protein
MPVASICPAAFSVTMPVAGITGCCTIARLHTITAQEGAAPMQVIIKKSPATEWGEKGM